MKVTVACVVAAHVPLVATFTPGYSRHRSTLKLFAANEDVPDIVKAYKKVKAEPKFPDLPTIPENPSLEPVVVLPEPVPVPVPVSAPLPELKVELPVETPPSPEIPSVVSDSIESMKDSLPGMNMKETADKINAQFKGLNDFMKATQEQVAVHSSERGSNNVPTLGEMMQNGLVPKRATFTETTMLPQGKAPTLVEYVLGGFKSPTGGVSRDGLAETKAHLGLMVENTFSLFGNKAPDNVHLNLPGNMAPETATGLAFVSLAVLVIAGQNNKRPPAPQKFEPIEEDEGPLSDLAKDVKKMAEQIKRLSDETKNLRSELKMAQDRLTLKELDISKEKLKSADVELQLKREIQKVTLKLQESESKNRALERQLTGTEDIRVTLAMSLEKIQALEDQLKMSTKENAPAPARAPVGKDKVPSPEPVKAKAPAPATPKEKTPVPAPVPVEAETPVVEQVPAAKKAPVPEPVPAKEKIPPAEPLTVDPPKPTPKAVPAKKASSRKKSAGLKGSTAKAEAPKSQDELKLSVEAPKTKKAPTPVADAPKPKKATTAVAKNPKTKEKKTVPETTSDGDDWSILSESTLSRKTVKELMDYLSDKGVKTNDEEGKPLKKALLVDAVRSV